MEAPIKATFTLYGKEDQRPYLESPTNAEEAIAQIKAIEEEYERIGISYSLEEVIADSHRKHPWLESE